MFKHNSPDQAVELNFTVPTWFSSGFVPLCTLNCSKPWYQLFHGHVTVSWRLFHAPLHTDLIVFEFNVKTAWHKCVRYADKEYALEESKDAHTDTHTQSHMGHSINEVAVLMSTVEWMFTATLKPSALINALSLCSVMRQPYDFTYPRPWSESLQTGDSDELIIPLSCNYPTPPSPSFSLSFSEFFSFPLNHCSALSIPLPPHLTQFLFISQVNLSLPQTHTSFFSPSFFPLYTNIYDYT